VHLSRRARKHGHSQRESQRNSEFIARQEDEEGREADILDEGLFDKEVCTVERTGIRQGPQIVNRKNGIIVRNVG